MLARDSGLWGFAREKPLLDEGVVGGACEAEEGEVCLGGLACGGLEGGGAVLGVDSVGFEDVEGAGLGAGEVVGGDASFFVGEDAEGFPLFPAVGDVGGASDEGAACLGVVGGVYFLDGADVAGFALAYFVGEGVVVAGGLGGEFGGVFGEGGGEAVAGVEVGYAEEHGDVVVLFAEVGEGLEEEFAADAFVSVAGGGGEPSESAHAEACFADAYGCGGDAEGGGEFAVPEGDSGVFVLCFRGAGAGGFDPAAGLAVVLVVGLGHECVGEAGVLFGLGVLYDELGQFGLPWYLGGFDLRAGAVKRSVGYRVVLSMSDSNYIGFGVKNGILFGRRFQRSKVYLKFRNVRFRCCHHV